MQKFKNLPHYSNFFFIYHIYSTHLSAHVLSLQLSFSLKISFNKPFISGFSFFFLSFPIDLHKPFLEMQHQEKAQQVPGKYYQPGIPESLVRAPLHSDVCASLENCI